jgi:hypothetical protein
MIPFKGPITKKGRIIFVLAYQAAVMLFFSIYFSRYFPNRHAALGHDYSYFFPNLLDGYYWFLENGIFRIPWFSPAFCGGVPAFPNPQNIFYSFPQFLTFAVGPLFGVFLTVIIFAWFGYIGVYLLVHKIFAVNRLISSLAATIFLMNGFFFNRMVIGHLAFHAFMLVPLICFFLLIPIKDQWPRTRRLAAFLCFSVVSGLIWSYMFYSGMTAIMIPVILGVLAIGCLDVYLKGNSRSFWDRFVLSGLLSLAISSVKLLPGLAYLNNFPRNNYKIPGTHVVDGIELILRSLMLPGTWSFSPGIIRNYQWTPQIHEYDYNVTPFPFILIVIGIIYFFHDKKWIGLKNRTLMQWLHAVLFIIILGIPYALNLFAPWWHDMLKLLPVIKNSSTMIRWLIIYILPILVVMALLINRTEAMRKISSLIFVVGVATVIIINVSQPSGYYQDQNYKPGNILDAYYNQRAHGGHPRINNVFVFTDIDGNPRKMGFGNDAIAIKASQMLCYEPIFGYRLEQYPLKSLEPGSITIQKEGVLNLKNPVCYVYPAENNCSPGDHFTMTQTDDMLKLAAYHRYKFNVPIKHGIAVLISSITLILSIFYLFIYGCYAISNKIKVMKACKLKFGNI